MRIVQHGKGLETTAAKTNGCAFCGTRLYLQQPFWQPVVGDVDRAIANLLTRVAGWRCEPVCCAVCPEQVASLNHIEGDDEK